MVSPSPSEFSFIARYSAARQRIWPEVEAFFRALPESLSKTADGFIDRLVLGTSPSKMLKNAFEEPAVARIAYLPLWHMEAYRRRGFPVKDHEILEECLFLSACMGFCAVRIWDDLVDEDKPGVPIDELLVANLLNLESFRQLQRVFPSDSTFWGYHDRFWKDYACAVGVERKRNRGGLAPFDEVALRLVGDKAAPLKSFPVAVALCAGQDQEIERLNELMDDFNQAAQLANDLQSLRRDLESRHYTVPGLAMGGVGLSGAGRAHGPEGLYEMSRTRSVLIDRLGMRRELWWFPYTERSVRLVRALVAFRARGGLWGILAAVRRFLRSRS